MKVCLKIKNCKNSFTGKCLRCDTGFNNYVPIKPETICNLPINYETKESKYWQDQKDFKIEVKEVKDDGTFEGYASVYKNVDLANEVVEPGAFKRTLDHKENTITLLWQHDTKQPIGIGVISDSDRGLKINGQLNLDVEKGREAHSLLKQKAIKGLSIGYDVVKDKWDKGVRYLKELKLWEVSVVTFPCNQLASVTSVKSKESKEINSLEAVKDFNSELQVRKKREEKWEMESAFERAVTKVIEDAELDAGIKVATVSLIFEQYKEAYLEWLGSILAQTKEKPELVKVGKPISNNRIGKLKTILTALTESVNNMQTLLNEVEPQDSGKNSSGDTEIKGLSLEDIVNEIKGFKTKEEKQEQHFNIKL